MENTEKYEPQFEGMTETEAKAFKILLTKFIQSYSKKDGSMSDKEWLKMLFKEELPNLSDEQAEQFANDTVESIKDYNANYSSVNDAASRGTSKEQWLAEQIAKASAGVSVIQHGEYLSSIDKALTNGNAQMMRTVLTKAGKISQAYNLDGFIAEQHHVNSFNANAALTKSKFFAEVKVPEPGETYGKNSFDIVIRDATNSKAVAVHQYKVKYGKDAQATIQMLKAHGGVTKYSNQQIVVPPEQVAEVQKAFPGKTVVSQIGGTDKVPITSNPLTKDQAKDLQLNTQNDGSVPTTDWNTFKTKDLAMQIGRNAGMVGLQAAAITAGFFLVEQAVRGEGIDIEETVELALRTGLDAGIKAAITGAVKVGVEKGVIGVIPQGTPAAVIANIVCVCIENVKILVKVASGELTMSQAIDRMGRTSVAMVFGLGWSSIGASIGPVVFAWIPVVEPVIGGLIGGIVGYMAGERFGGLVYEGLKAVARGVINTCKSSWNTTRSVGSRIRTAIAY